MAVDIGMQAYINTLILVLFNTLTTHNARVGGVGVGGGDEEGVLKGVCVCVCLYVCVRECVCANICVLGGWAKEVRVCAHQASCQILCVLLSR